MSVKPESEHAESRTIIGWSEYVDFPEWGIQGVRAKVDTGARTSALHVEDIEALGDGHVRFHVVTGRKGPFGRTAVCAKVVKWGRVRSSSGHYTVRCFVKTRIRVGPVEKEVELSLVSREKMLYRMLLGRRALARDFLVDVSRRRMLGGRRKTKKQRKKTSSA